MKKPIMARPIIAYRKKFNPLGYFSFNTTTHQSSNSVEFSRGRAFAHGAMGRRIDPSWSGPIELFFVPASSPRLV